MAKAIVGFSITKPQFHNPVQTPKSDSNPSLRQCSTHRPFSGWHYQLEGSKSRRGPASRLKALPHFPFIHNLSDWPLMAVIVEHMDNQVVFINHKYIWHLSDRAIKNVYVFYLFFTCWGCLFFGSMKDPFYDSEAYRKDGGDGTGFWLYDKQEDIEESARAELWREELIEEIEQKVGGLRELEEAGRK